MYITNTQLSRYKKDRIYPSFLSFTCRCIAQKFWFNIGTCSIDTNSFECEIYVTKHHILTRYTTATNKNYTILSGRSARNILEGHLIFIFEGDCSNEIKQCVKKGRMIDMHGAKVIKIRVMLARALVKDSKK
jgi:hypothetical protein